MNAQNTFNADRNKAKFLHCHHMQNDIADSANRICVSCEEPQCNFCLPLMFFFSKMIKFRPRNPFYLVNPVGLEIRPLCMIGELSLGRNPTVRKEQKRAR